MFYSHTDVMQEMNRQYDSGRFVYFVIYGRERVGKTTLINEFCEGKPTIYFPALRATARENLKALSEAVQNFQDPLGPALPAWEDFGDVLDVITRMAAQERFVFVIDNFPYLLKVEAAMCSRLQHLIDHKWKYGKLFLILCGSPVRFMQFQVLGYDSPLYDRNTSQVQVKALSYREMTALHPGLSAADQALLYGITGGIAHYINKLEIDTDLDQAIQENLLCTTSYLFDEAEKLLRQELRDLDTYNTILKAAAKGAYRLREIAAKTGLESSVCAKYLKVLQDLGVIRKETPVPTLFGRKARYVIDDNFLRFWYRFIPGNMAAICRGQIRETYAYAVKRFYPEYMDLVFKNMCREYVLRYAKDLPFRLRDAGPWWGRDPVTREEVQIDLVGIPSKGSVYLIASCSYRDKKTESKELELLHRNAHAFKLDGHFFYCMFSRCGFSEELLEQEKQGKVRLFTLEDLYR